ncbi:VOC family protein [Terriglobus tenax]|uniref:VOC family protein n=1 Tax=Terriglobus tenax TaxID=1111115 RepID=UPI0021DF5719|nr:VOC family protein [Terriglobus tenax]
MKLNAYLNFGGNCGEAFAYYEKHLGAKILFKMTFDQSPEPVNIPVDPKGVMYANLAIAGTQIMGSDVPNYEPVRSSYLSYAVDTKEQFDQVWKALTDGGEILMPASETFYAHDFGMVRDRFKVLWMVIREKPMQ